MNWKKVAPYLVIVLLLIYIFTLEKEVEVIRLPARENSVLITNPKPVVLRDTFLVNNGQIRIIERRNKVNQELLQKYNSLKDSVSKLQVFKEAITERKYVETLIDSTQTITVESSVIGTLTEQKISYRTNPITIERKSLKTPMQVYLGAFTTLPTNLAEPRLAVGANLNIKHNKTIYNIGFDTEQRVSVGASFKLF